jgi:hypothetical protein
MFRTRLSLHYKFETLILEVFYTLCKLEVIQSILFSFYSHKLSLFVYFALHNHYGYQEALSPLGLHQHQQLSWTDGQSQLQWPHLFGL